MYRLGGGDIASSVHVLNGFNFKRHFVANRKPLVLRFDLSDKHGLVPSSSLA